MNDMNEILASWDIPSIQSDVAIRVATHAQAKDTNFSLDPATILIIINCIISLIRLLYVCNSKKNIEYYFKNPGLIQKHWIKKSVKKNFSKKHYKHMYLSILEVCSQMSEKEIKQLLESVKEK
jgi:hypothetical protein